MALVFFVLTAIWYFINFKEITQFVRQASSGSVANLYGHSGPFVSKFRFWVHYFWDGSFGGRTSIAATIIVALMAVKYLRERNSPMVFFAILQVALPLFIFSFQINEETRYLFPVYPSLIVVLFELAQTSLVLRLLLSFTCLLRFLELGGASVHLWPRTTKTMWVSEYKDQSKNLEILHQIIDLTCAQLGDQNVIGVDTVHLNNVTMNFYAKSDRNKWQKQCVYHSPGYAVLDSKISWDYINQFKFRFFVTYDETSLTKIKDAFNQTSFDIRNRIRSDPDFKLLKIIDTIEIYERILKK